MRLWEVWDKFQQDCEVASEWWNLQLLTLGASLLAVLFMLIAAPVALLGHLVRRKYRIPYKEKKEGSE